jgi:acylphosphatase
MFTRDLANQFRVSGWVKNRADGRVDVEIEGEHDSVEAVTDALYARGSYVIKVDRVTVTPVTPTGEKGFEIR